MSTKYVERVTKIKFVTKYIAFIFAIILVLLLAGSGTVKAATSITNWSSTGGSPTNKDNPQDLIYKVQQGDTITFTATSNQSCDHVWEVVKGVDVLTTHVERNVKTSSFTWTVPSEKNNWDIVVFICPHAEGVESPIVWTVPSPMNITTPVNTIYPSPSGVGPRPQLAWTLTTSALITVSPEESIQDAIDSLPPEGGVVELTEGTWNITSLLRIQKYTINGTEYPRVNVTLRGAGINKTVLSAQASMPQLFIMTFYDNFTEKAHWYFYNSKNPLDHDQTKFLRNIVVEDIHFTGNRIENLSPVVGTIDIKKSRISRIKVDEGIRYGFTPHYCLKSAITDNIITHSLYLTDPLANVAVDWLNNHFSHGYVLRLPNGAWGAVTRGYWDYNILIQGNYFDDCIDGLYIYSTREGIARNNIIANGRRNGIALISSGIVLVENNVVYNVDTYGGPAIKQGGDVLGPKTVRNNIVVNNTGDGISSDIANVSYNCVYGNTGSNWGGTNSISADPLFVDPENGDFHLESQYGRWDGSAWVKDNATSPCIDAGDPSEKDPDGTRINMGAYGGTIEASKSPSGTLSGKVTDKDTGAPIEGAVVSTNGYSGTTDASGNYLITLPIGNYTLTASKTGYRSSSATVEVLENQTTIVDFQLTRDITPPEISNVNAISITPATAAITWETDENSDSRIYYGETEDLGMWKTKTELVTSHSITLTGLSPNTTYYYQVYSTDEAGNTGNSSIKTFKTTEEPNLVGYWKFDEGSGSVAYDSSGNNNNGTIHGATWTTGRLGSALQFDGTDYVDCGSDSSLNISGSNGITYEAWIYPYEWGNDGTIVRRGYNTDLDINNGVEFRWYLRGVGSVTKPVSDYSLNTWYHIVGTYDGSTMNLYINGENVASAPAIGTISPEDSPDSPVYIGREPKSGDYFKGIIDEVRIYKKALSAEEVLAHYQAGATGTLTGTVKDKDTGLPIIGATVTADGHFNTTNSTGRYTITLAIGNYTVTISKEGYQTQSKTAEVLENQTTELNFTLAPINLYLNIKTLKDNYQIGEIVNITDPSEKDGPSFFKLIINLIIWLVR